MRIINQDKTKSIEFENYDVSVDDNYIHASGMSNIMLGKYSTEERTSGVFDDIHKAYMAKIPVYIMPIS